MTGTAALIADGPALLDLDERGVATIRLNRPAAANAMDLGILIGLHAALLRCHAHPDVRVVVLTGAGRNFCAGGDVHDFLAHGDARTSHVAEVSNRLQTVSAMLTGLDAPTIASVHGYAAGGGGLGLIGSCDFVIAGRSAKFVSGAVAVGLVPDAGQTAVLTQLVGLRKAMELSMTKVTVDAAEALRLGLITKVVPDDRLSAETDELAAALAESALDALAECKHLIWNGIGAPISQALSEESRATVRLAGTDDCEEGLRAAANRRAPVFRARQTALEVS
jgi:2-(1,2-epoxy-1,2-dihydrophenyl)acetyl-CoA isomerase